jgi:hypothetical protein
VPRGHARQLVLCHQIGFEHAAEVPGGNILKRPPIAHRRIVDEAIEATVPGHDRVDGHRRARQVGDVEGSGEGTGNGARDLAGTGRVAPIDAGGGAGRRHPARDLEPETSRRAGDQHDAPGQREAFESPRLPLH